MLAGKLGALVRERWGGGVAATPSRFPGGAGLVEDATGWLLLDADGERRLGGALAWARRHEVTDLHLLVDDPDTAAILVRRGQLFTAPPSVWIVRDRELVASGPAPIPPAPAALAPAAELLRVAALAVGAEPVVEQGELLVELAGLEVARTRTSGDDVSLDVGVGRFDQEAFAMMHPDLADREALARAVDTVARTRRPDSPRHPLNQLAPERWLRAAAVSDPALVGARSLEPVEPAVPRRNLKDAWPASAAGIDEDGRPLVVTFASATDLEAVPCAADDRARHLPGARLRVAVAGPAVAPAIRAQAAALLRPADLVSLEPPWVGPACR